eukprot:tig00020601_g11719.t1
MAVDVRAQARVVLDDGVTGAAAVLERLVDLDGFDDLQKDDIRLFSMDGSEIRDLRALRPDEDVLILADDNQIVPALRAGAFLAARNRVLRSGLEEHGRVAHAVPPRELDSAFARCSDGSYRLSSLSSGSSSLHLPTPRAASPRASDSPAPAEARKGLLAAPLALGDAADVVASSSASEPDEYDGSASPAVEIDSAFEDDEEEAEGPAQEPRTASHAARRGGRGAGSSRAPGRGRGQNRLRGRSHVARRAGPASPRPRAAVEARARRRRRRRDGGGGRGIERRSRATAHRARGSHGRALRHGPRVAPRVVPRLRPAAVAAASPRRGRSASAAEAKAPAAAPAPAAAADRPRRRGSASAGRAPRDREGVEKARSPPPSPDVDSQRDSTSTSTSTPASGGSSALSSAGPAPRRTPPLHERRAWYFSFYRFWIVRGRPVAAYPVAGGRPVDLYGLSCKVTAARQQGALPAAPRGVHSIREVQCSTCFVWLHAPCAVEAGLVTRGRLAHIAAAGPGSGVEGDFRCGACQAAS